MSKLWLQGGSIILDSAGQGQAVLCDTCPCEEEQVECVFCPGGIAQCWEIAVAGVTNVSCTFPSSCTTLNGTFTLKHVPHATDCLFQSDEGARMCFFIDQECTLAAWEMRSPQINPPNYWLLQAFLGNQAIDPCDTGITAATYKIHKDNFDCNGPNTFSLDSSSSHCSGYPSTISASPVTCP